jgi:hypothetical protein
MNSFDSLVLVVVYPGSEKYFQEYFDSIKNQSRKDFDLLILNDGIQKMPNVELSSYKLYNVESNQTIAQIRMKGIQYAFKQNYRFLIFSDIDDFYSQDRIEISCAELAHNDFVYNSIIPVDIHSKPQQNLTKINYPNQLTSYKTILNFNLIGMSNSAIDLKNYGNIYIPKDLIAVDWWLFTIQLIQLSKGRYLEDVITYYRQSDDNVVGSKKKLDYKRLEMGIKVKHTHYTHVHKFCRDQALGKAEGVYKRKLDEINTLILTLKDAQFKENYIKVINNNMDVIYKGWWSEILPINEWSIYE